MTWYPLQAALKMSTIPGAIRATLDVLIDHINADPQDPTHPDTLIVWESRERLADEVGFSEVTIRDHLKRLCGVADLRPGQRVMVLRRVTEARSHRAARYELVPEALDALADRERRKAFEQGFHQPTHPYQRWLTWLEARHTQPVELGVSSLPQDPDDESLGESFLPQAETVGESSFPQLGKAPSPELPVVDQKDKTKLTFFVSGAAPSTPEKKGTPERSRRRKKRKPLPRRLVPECTPPPQGEDRQRLIEDLTAWAQEGTSRINAPQFLDLWLFKCEARHYAFPDWFGEGKSQLREAWYKAEAQAEQQQARAAQITAFIARLEAEEAAMRPSDPEAWTDLRPVGDGFYGFHLVCQDLHQCHGRCPASLGMIDQDLG